IGDISAKFLRWTIAWNVCDVRAVRFVTALCERRILSTVADRRYRASHTLDGTEPVPPIILSLATEECSYCDSALSASSRRQILYQRCRRSDRVHVQTRWFSGRAVRDM